MLGDKEKQTIVRSMLPVLPKDDRPVYIKFKDRCYAQEVVSKAMMECLEEILTQIIDTSKTPQSILMRIAAFQKDPENRVKIWTEAFRRVLLREKQLPEDMVQQKHKGKCLVVRIEDISSPR
jgi:hypothetical protein